MIEFIKRLLHEQKYEYGEIRGKVSRRNIKTGEVQFILWREGEHKHKAHYWHRYDPTHWVNFKPYVE